MQVLANRSTGTEFSRKINFFFLENLVAERGLKLEGERGCGVHGEREGESIK